MLVTILLLLAKSSNETTKMEFSLPISHFAELNVFNVCGQKVSTLLDEYKEPGSYVLTPNLRYTLAKRLACLPGDGRMSRQGMYVYLSEVVLEGTNRLL